MRLVMDARARRILRRLPRINLYSAAELALMALVATQGARLVWAVVTPVAPVGEWRPVAAGVAGSIEDGADPFFRLSGAGQPAAVTSLQLTLFGTRIDEAMGRGSAIVAGPDGVQRSVSVGEEVAPGVRLKEVAFDHITVDRGGASEDLFLDQSGAVTPVGGPGHDVPSAPPGTEPVPNTQGPGANGTAAVAQQLRSEIGFIPRIDGGRVSGLVVRSQGTGSLFRRSGLQDGDVVTAIGGRSVTGPGDLERVAAEFGGSASIPVTVERGGQTLPLGIPVSPVR